MSTRLPRHFNPDQGSGARGRLLSQVIELEESKTPWVVSFGATLTAGLVFSGIGWAWMTPVKEVAQTQGSVLPAGRTHNVQHLEGGIVSALHVRDGERVEAGDLLIELSREANLSDVNQITSRIVALEARMDRLDALLTDRSALGPVADADPLQRQLFLEQRAALEDQMQVIEADRHRLEREISAKQSQINSLQEGVRLLTERQKLQNQGRLRDMVPLVDLLESEARLAQTVAQVRAIQAEIDIAEEGVVATEKKKLELMTRWRQDLRLEAEQASAELAEARAEQTRFSDRLQRTAILAPANGIVQGLKVTTLSAVVEPGQVILEIVPVDDDLVVETRVEPKDVGYIRAGQRVDVKVTGFEAQRFGPLEGSLRSVSPSTFLDEDRKPYYRAEVMLEQSFLGDDPTRNRLMPGMIVQANIITGEKTVLQYLLKPVYRGLSSALQER